MATQILGDSTVKSIGSFFGLSFAGGGYTGDGARSGGIDGMGGFMAVMHPQETVIDHTMWQPANVQPANAQSSGGNSVVVNIVESPGQGGTQTSRSEAGTDYLTIFVEKVKNSIAGDIARGSGSVPGAMATTYGLNRVAGAY
ncbi:hypothetical protein GALL_548060 [mine drainage metagenome]|uniref:Uncharacterized protein n=1 Tax=mine drainage metagenome TaxID=410659 RepID=A0A1J5NXZ9_9ZZZZ